MAQTTVPSSTPSEQPTRRSALATMAAGILGGGTVAVVATMAAASQADPHLAWHNEAMRLIDLVNGPERPGVTDADVEAELDRSGDLFDLIAETPAATLAGVCAQLGLAHYCAATWEGDRNEPVEMALRNAVATLERLAGGRA